MGGCAQMCKCFLILFNTLFALLGFGMVSLGLWLRFGADTKGFFDVDLKTTEFAIGVTVLIVTGVFMILVAVVGDLGACNQSKSALSVFACLLSILMIAEIAAGVMAFMWSDRVAQKLADFYVSIYAQYVNSRAEGQAVTLRLFHNAFNCCGVGGPIELFVQDTCPSSSSFIQQIQTPNCPGVIRSVFDSKAPLVMGGFLGTAGIMLVALVCSVIVRKRDPPPHSSPPAYMLLSSAGPPPASDPRHV